MQQLNNEQLKAVTAPDGPILVLAGAGSGKTRVLTNRILHLVNDCGVSPYNVLAITFTNKAANEMKSRLREFCNNSEMLHVSTIHSFCATVLRREAESINKRTNFTIYSDDEKTTILKSLTKDISDDGDSRVVGRLSDVISQIKNDADSFLDFCGKCQNQRQLEDYLNEIPDKEKRKKIQQLLYTGGEVDEVAFMNAIASYQKRMDENNALDFDDLLFFVHKLFSSCPRILEKYQERYQYICIDEFQDTNKVQYEIFKLLASKHRNLFVVGDDDQSIYSWRGADIRNILHFERDFPEAQVFKLEQNYRSTKSILNVANDIIAKNGSRHEKQLWTENEDGVRVEIFNAYNESDEAYYVLKNIRGLKDYNGYNFSDCAILMRINALSRSFEMECRSNNIPYKVFGGFKFFERKEVKDVLAYLNLIYNPFDTISLFRALNVPQKRGIGDATVKKLRQHSTEYGLSVIEIISDERNMLFLNAGTRAKLKDFYDLYSDLCDLSKLEKLSVFISKLLQILGFREAYMNDDDLDRAMNIDEFEQSVVSFCDSFPSATLADFLQSISLSSDNDKNADADCVTIATIHSVKGLEFKAVFVVGLDDGIFPSARSLNSKTAFEEERRLMYVAATRAQKRLYVTHATSRFMYGMRKSLLPSKYFGEIQSLVSPQVAKTNFDKFVPPEQTREVTTKTDKEASEFKAGQLVLHQSFGKGLILSCGGGTAEVLFENCGKKSLNIKFAPLKILK